MCIGLFCDVAERMIKVYSCHVLYFFLFLSGTTCDIREQAVDETTRR